MSTEELILSTVMEKTLRFSWIARRSNLSIIRKSVPNILWKDWCWSWNCNTFDLICTTDSLEKIAILGKVEGGRRWEWERMRCLYDLTDLTNMSFSKFQEVGDGQGRLECCSPWGLKESGTTKWLNWTEPIWVNLALKILKLQVRTEIIITNFIN